MQNNSTPASSTVQRPIDLGAQVGIRRNLEFAAGGRTNRLITGMDVGWSNQPTYNTPVGRIEVSTFASGPARR